MAFRSSQPAGQPTNTEMPGEGASDNQNVYYIRYTGDTPNTLRIPLAFIMSINTIV